MLPYMNPEVFVKEVTLTKLKKEGILILFKRLLFCLGTVILLGHLVSSPEVVRAIEPFAIVEKEIAYENSNNWSDIPSLWVESMRPVLIALFSNPENKKNKVGLFTIKNARLVSSKEFSSDVTQLFPNVEKYKTTYGTVKVYYLAIDYQVHQESEFYRNGINYLLAIVVQEKGKWKLAAMSVAPVNIIVSQGIGFGTEHEKKRAEEMR